METRNRSASAPVHLAGGKPADASDFILLRRFAAVRSSMPLGGDVLLDFGCGNGAQTRMFLPHFGRVVGVDVSRHHLIEFAADTREHGSTCIGVHYDGLRLPLPDASVDTVVSFEVLEHVADESTALDEIHRVLRPGGWLAMSVPNRWWIFETHGADLPWLPWNRVPFFSWLPKRLHDRWARARIYRRREITAKLLAKGFVVQQSAYITAPMDVLPEGRFRRSLRGTVFRPHLTPVPFFATAVLVVCRRSFAAQDSEVPHGTAVANAVDAATDGDQSTPLYCADAGLAMSRATIGSCAG